MKRVYLAKDGVMEYEVTINKDRDSFKCHYSNLGDWTDSYKGTVGSYVKSTGNGLFIGYSSGDEYVYVSYNDAEQVWILLNEYFGIPKHERFKKVKK